MNPDALDPLSSHGSHGGMSIDPRLDSDSFATDNVHVAAIDGREQLSRPFRFDLELVCTAGEIDLDAAAGAEVTLTLSQGGAALRRIHGILTEIEQLDVQGRAHRAYRAVLVPRLGRLGF